MCSRAGKVFFGSPGLAAWLCPRTPLWQTSFRKPPAGSRSTAMTSRLSSCALRHGVNKLEDALKIRGTSASSMPERPTPDKLSTCRASLIWNAHVAASIIPPTVHKPFARKMAAFCMRATIWRALREASRRLRFCRWRLPCGATMPSFLKLRR